MVTFFFGTFLSVPVKEHLCTLSDRNVPFCSVQKCNHRKGKKMVPNEVQLEQHFMKQKHTLSNQNSEMNHLELFTKMYLKEN